MPWVPLDIHYYCNPRIQAAGAMTPFALSAYPALLCAARNRGVTAGAKLPVAELATMLHLSEAEAKAAVEALIAVGIAKPLRYHTDEQVHVAIGRSARVALSSTTRKRIVIRDGRRCGLCGHPVAESDELHIDHIVPVASGGTNDDSNLQVAHGDCNRRKGARG